MNIKTDVLDRLRNLFGFRTGADQGLAGFVGLVLLEVLDEAGSEILGFGLPLGSVCIGVARVEDVGVHAREFGGNFEVEVRDGLGRGLVDAAVEDASMMPRVSRMEIRLPVPFQPVFTR